MGLPSHLFIALLGHLPYGPQASHFSICTCTYTEVCGYVHIRWGVWVRAHTLRCVCTCTYIEVCAYMYLHQKRFTWNDHAMIYLTSRCEFMSCKFCFGVDNVTFSTWSDFLGFEVYFKVLFFSKYANSAALSITVSTHAHVWWKYTETTVAANFCASEYSLKQLLSSCVFPFANFQKTFSKVDNI